MYCIGFEFAISMLYFSEFDICVDFFTMVWKSH